MPAPPASRTKQRGPEARESEPVHGSEGDPADHGIEDVPQSELVPEVPVSLSDLGVSVLRVRGIEVGAPVPVVEGDEKQAEHNRIGHEGRQRGRAPALGEDHSAPDNERTRGLNGSPEPAVSTIRGRTVYTGSKDEAEKDADGKREIADVEPQKSGGGCRPERKCSGPRSADDDHS